MSLTHPSILLLLATTALAACNQASKDMNQPMSLPPGWTQADMQASMDAGTPGKMQQYLAQSAGSWRSENTMWMAPDTQPMHTRGSAKITPIMGGRYVRVDSKSDMPGMPPFCGIGIYGFDNVSQQFVATWIDNMGTGIMNGTGTLSPDNKTLTWTYSYNCPITKKPTPIREVQTITGPNTNTLDMFTNDPKTGKEYQMMHIDFTRP